MNTGEFEKLNIGKGDIIGFTNTSGENYRCFYYGGYNKSKGHFACYNFKSGRVEEVALDEVKTLERG